MPLERSSKSFKDLSLTFKANPVNKDLLSIKDEVAIARSIRNLVSTYPGERPFSPGLGSEITRSLFENFDSLTASDIKDQISTTISLYEPRVKLNNVIVNANFENQEFNVTITYKIVGIDVPPQELNFALQPIR
ncbi:MAG: GPW/gp25 family protein [Candidatus Nanopelagicaceae bacterium]